MLRELAVNSIGVISSARVDFGSGFNVFTGETGAGKTLLLGALELCLGVDGAATRGVVRHDTKAVAVFDDCEGEEVIFGRESSSAGRLRSTLNGLPTSVDALRLRASDVIAIHGQHDSLRLRQRGEILSIIDRFGDVDTQHLMACRHTIAQLRTERLSLGDDEAAIAREIDFLQFSQQEITQARLSDAEELTRVMAELERLTELRSQQEELARIVDAVDGDGDDALVGVLARFVGQIPAVVSDATREQLLAGVAQVREAMRDVARLIDPDLFDPRIMNDLEDRAALLQALCRKYGGSLEAVIREGEIINERLAVLQQSSSRRKEIDDTLSATMAEEESFARVVRRERDFAAVQLTNAVREQLPRVALVNASLRLHVDGRDGSDCEIFFTPNPGQPEGPLHAMASGGELSRVLLALSLVTHSDESVSVFDEVDAGVGGQVAQQIGQCLREVGNRQQVIAITHLASVAARAQHHFVIEKMVDGDTTTTTVREVRGEERIAEIARMLVGDGGSPEARALASRMLSAV